MIKIQIINKVNFKSKQINNQKLKYFKLKTLILHPEIRNILL